MSKDENSGKEVEVNIVFDKTKMTKEQINNLQLAEKYLGRAGIVSDTSFSSEGLRDWQWDWSLRGPVKVQFIKFTEDNENNRYKQEVKEKEDDKKNSSGR